MGEIQASYTLEAIVQRIFELRGLRVMLDSDLATLYGVETGALVRAVKRNLERFPEDLMFQLTKEEWENLKSQIEISNLRCQNGISSSWGGRRFAPYAFTEHGAIMLSSVLRSARAVEVSLLVVRAFVWLRRAVPAYKELAEKVAELEKAVGQNSEDIKEIIQVLQQLIAPPDNSQKRIGF